MFPAMKDFGISVVISVSSEHQNPNFSAHTLGTLR